MAKILLLIISLCLISCNFGGSKKDTKIRISSAFINGSETSVDISGGGMLYLINKDKAFQSAIQLDGSQVTVEIDSGNWDFAVLAWDGTTPMSGTLKCAKESLNISNDNSEIHLTLSTTACDDDFFSPSNFRSNSETNSLRIVSCQDVSTVSAGSNCDGTNDKGFAGSYKVKLLPHPDLVFGNLGSINMDQASPLVSECFQAESGSLSVKDLGLKIPFGSPKFRASVLIEAYGDGSCNLEKKKFFFPSGLKNLVSTIFPAKSEANSNYGDVYIEFGRLDISGPTNAGSALLNNSSMIQLTVNNRTSAILNNVTATISSPFSITQNNCGTTIAKKSNCMIMISFTPTALGNFSADLQLNFDVGGIGKLIKKTITGSGVANLPPVASSLNISLTEDTPSIVTLGYVDAENDLASTCSISNLNNVKINQACACSAGGVCTVGIIGLKDYAGAASFNYTVNANGAASNSATATLNISQVNDAPVAISTSQKFTPNSTITVRLPYKDVENDLATNCTVTNIPANLTIATSCSCSPGGICSVDVTTSSTPLIGSFSFTVSDALTSNTAFAALNPNFPNNFISLPQNAPGYNKIAWKEVKDTYVDSSGRIFVATSNGLSISTDGGTTFQTKTTANGLSHNSINNITPDSNGKIYLSTSSGLTVTADNGVSFSTKLGSNIINATFIDSNGYLYISTYSGLFISTDGGGTFTNKTVANSALANNTVMSTFVDSSGTIYCASSSGLSILYGGASSFVTLTAATDGLASNYVQDIFVDTSGTMYASTMSGLSIKTPSNTTFSTASGLASNFVNSVIQTSSGDLYVSTSNGISKKLSGGTAFTTILSSKSVKRTFVTSTGNIYASTNSGLNILNYPSTSFTEKTVTTGLGGEIKDVYVDSKGVIYAATWNGLAISSDGGSNFVTKTITDDLADNNVQGVKMDSNGILYVSTYNGLSISTNSGASFTNKNTATGLGGNNVKEVFIKDDIIYVSTSGGISISYNRGNTFVNKTVANSGLVSDNVNSVFVTNSGTIYVSTQTGLSISNDNGTSFSTLFSGSIVNNVFVDSKNYIYVAKDGSLSVSRDEGLTYTFYGPGLLTTKVLVDNNDVVYVSNMGGLVISTNSGYTYSVISSPLGLSGRVNSVFIDSNGIIYTATSNGIFVSTNNALLRWMNNSNQFISSYQFGTPILDTTATVKLKNVGNTEASNITTTVSGASNFTTTTPVSTCTGLLPTEECSVTLFWTNIGTSGAKLGTINASYGMSSTLNLSGTK